MIGQCINSAELGLRLITGLDKNTLNVYVMPILNVSRKFSMCIIFSTGYIKIYNIKTLNEYYIQQFTFVLPKCNTNYPIYDKALLNP